MKEVFERVSSFLSDEEQTYYWFGCLSFIDMGQMSVIIGPSYFAKNCFPKVFRGMSETSYPPSVSKDQYESIWKEYATVSMNTQMREDFVHVIAHGALGENYLLKDFVYLTTQAGKEYAMSSFGINHEPMDNKDLFASQVTVSLFFFLCLFGSFCVNGSQYRRRHCSTGSLDSQALR